MHQEGANRLASSRETSNGPDWRDVHTSLQYLQEDHNCTIVLSVGPCGTKMKPDLHLWVTATKEDTETGVPQPLLSVNSRFTRMNVQTLEAAIMSLVHQLDYELVKDQLPDLIE